MTAPEHDSAGLHFPAFERKMQDAGLEQPVIDNFRLHYTRLVHGDTGLLSRDDIDPVAHVPDAEQLTCSEQAGREALQHTVVIKLNGGLGTSMGLERAKSLIEVREGLSFLDITALQLRSLAERDGIRVPLVLMDSFSTSEDSLAALAKHGDLSCGLPQDFMQHKVPKVLRDTLAPAHWPQQPDLEWCPPGHGDIYLALVTSGLLEALRAADVRYAFVSNIDNLGAVLDPVILGHIVQRGIPFLMEVADRTHADRKGGHLARLKDGRVALRESAQCPPEDSDEFQNIERYRYFNTNNLWIDLRALQALLRAYTNVLPLPMIRNAKTLDPKDASSPAVYQLESAMGAAISLFDGAEALRVPRTRFAPVKTTDDLLGLWSDAYVLTADHRVIPNPARSLPPPIISLDARHYRMLPQLIARVPQGAPSLVDCASLTVRGDVTFGRGVVLRGHVHVEAADGDRMHIPDGSVIEG